MKTFLTLLALAVICLAAHVPVMKMGLNLLTSDYAVFPLLADEMRTGHWYTFCFQQPNGGITLTVLRALWVSLITPVTHITAHMTFTYGVSPLLLCWGVYAMARAYFATRATAFFVGLAAALSFHYLIAQQGNEFHIACLMFGCIFLAWRARLTNPLMELTPRGLLAAGFLAGLSLYTSRAAIIFILGFFLPWEYAKSILKKTFARPTHPLVITAALSTFLFLRLWIGGETLGTIAGRNIKLGATPQFKISVLLIVLLIIHTHRKTLYAQRRIILKACLLLGLGFTAGFLPELLYWSRHKALPPSWMAAPFTSEEFMQILLNVPRNFRNLFMVGETYGQLMLPATGIANFASPILATAAFMALAKAARKQKKFIPPLATALLAVMIYATVPTYTREAPLRYLLPVFIPFFIALGTLFETCINHRHKRLLATALMALFLIHSISQLQNRMFLLQKYRQSSEERTLLQVVDVFQKAKTPVVISDTFAYSNQFAVISNQNPPFVSTGREYGPPRAFSLAQTSKHIGILITRNDTLQKFETQYKLRMLTRVGPYTLYEGERLSP